VKGLAPEKFVSLFDTV
ncbi:hypothetical protein Tco_1520411, partial [Tanacetum coccineum]